MLKKANRANTKEIERIFKACPPTGREGRLLNSPSLTLKYILTQTKDKKISFIAPKSVARLAVKRNALRRKGYDALSKYMDQLPLGITGAFIFRKPETDTPTLENEIKGILNKIN